MRLHFLILLLSLCIDCLVVDLFISKDIRHSMPFPLNRVIMNALAEVDLLEVLKLASTSSSLHRFIFEQVVTISSLYRFLREHQYALFHDTYDHLFSNQEVACMHEAFEELRRRHGESLYGKFVNVLAPLLGRTPLQVFQKSPAVTLDIRVPNPPDHKGRPGGFFTFTEVYFSYSQRLKTSFLHRPEYMHDSGQLVQGFYGFHASTPNPFLREDFLFCKQYIDDFNRCIHLSLSAAPYLALPMIPGEDSRVLLDGVKNIQEICKEHGLSSLLERACIKGALHIYLQPSRFDPQQVSLHTFRGLFEVPGRMEMWTPAEFGSWYAIGLSQYGIKGVEALIDQSFKNTREMLVWLFLGAHNWFHETEKRKEDEDEVDSRHCCDWMTIGFESEFVNERMSSISRDDRIWILEQIIRRASEFQSCRDLGANLFNYFVVRDFAEADVMLSILIDEISYSRLQYLFEYAISIAVDEYRRRNKAPLEFKVARRFVDRLMRKDLNLYILLTGSDGYENLGSQVYRLRIVDEYNI